MKYKKIGVITSAFGVAGYVKVFPTTDDPTRFEKLTKVELNLNSKQFEMNIANVKYQKNLVLLKLRGVDDKDSADRLRTAQILIPESLALPLAEDEFYYGDLLDIVVSDTDGNVIGVITDILSTGANDVYVVENEAKKQLLIPAIKQCILEVDTENKTMKVNLIDGLLDL